MSAAPDRDRHSTVPPPRVCHLSTRLVKGGADFNIFYNLLHSAPRFEQTLIIGGEYDAELVGRLRDAGVRVQVFNSIRRSINPLNELRAYAQLRTFFRRNQFDIIFTHNAKTGILGRFAAPRGGLMRRIGAHLLRRPSDGCLCTVGVDTPAPDASGTGTPGTPGAPAVPAAPALARPVIVHGLHGMSFTDTGSRASFYLFRALERAAARRTDHFVSVGHTIRDLMLAASVGRPEQYRIIRSGMDIDRFRAAAADPARRAATRRDLGCTGADTTDTAAAGAADHTAADTTVLFVVVARIERRKGQHHFLQAFARALQTRPGSSPPNIRAAIVGEGAERAACEKLARELGISDRVVFTGFRDNPEDYLAAAEVVCLSSEWEGVPQSLVQAAAVGRAAVAFDVPGIREILSDGRTGIVVPYPDIDAFATAIRTLAADPGLRAEYGAAAAAINLDDFRLPTMVSQTEALYRELCP